MRRRVVGRGFEGFELPQSRGWRPSADDMDLLQGQEMPRRRLVAQVPARGMGPEAFGQPFGRAGLLDQPGAQNIGRSVDLTVNPAGVVTNGSILNIIGDDTEARVVSVTLFGDPSGGAIEQDLFVRVQWGSGGVQDTVDVDIQNGTVLQLCASSIRIEARGTISAPFRVSAHVGYGALGDKKAQRTVNVGALAVGATSAAFVIPNFARDLQIHRNPSTANLLLQLLPRAGAGVLSEFNVGNGPGNGTEIIRLLEAAGRFQIVNGLGAPLVNTHVVFGLCL